MSLNDDLQRADKYLRGLEDETVKEIIKAYNEALKQVKAELTAMYQRFGEGVTHIDMAKFGRLQKLEREISAILISATGKNARTLMRSLVEIYDESLLYTGFAVERETQMKLAYTRVNQNVVIAAIQNPVSGLTLAHTLRKNRQEIISRIQREITQGLILGEGYKKMSKRITEAFNGDAVKAVRVVSTEAHRVAMHARLDGIKHAASKGVQMVKVWDASLDSKTRPAHQKLDGKKIPIDADFESSAGGKGPAPGSMRKAADDVNCRCSIRTEIQGYEAHIRRARNEQTGRTEVIPYTTYEEWKKNRIS
ncbi:phage head morphogenesis protein [Paenibacillus alkaliterrae]|uniref:phage head morphogenesis protein n=1 Tax=Paenibacillus alkaliterrae TaxID=320909 RepID=UPI001F47573B|nr:phage minor head protein [Paenibacillus alkaliterrae]MCF2939035.1 phage head morphogenesis protein [Paenibacillus alkaliterrae]